MVRNRENQEDSRAYRDQLERGLEPLLLAVELGRIQESLGYKSRSKLLRATMGSLLNEYNIMESLKGHVDSVFVVTYKAAEKNRVSDLLHEFEDTIKTVVHQHHVGICLEVLIVCADAGRIRELFSLLKRHRGVRSVSCSLL